MQIKKKISDSWIVAGISLAVFGIVLFSPAVLGDSDSWWHIKAGDWIIANRSIPRIDPFSDTGQALPWLPHEWLSEVMFAGAYKIAGWSGVQLLTAMAIGWTVYLLGARLGRHLSGVALTACLVIAVSLVAGHFLARPHALAFPIIVLWTGELLRAREEERAPSYRFLPLMLLWANIHGGYAFGIALIAPFALEALVAAKPYKRWGTLIGWAVFGLGALLAALCTPFGLDGLLFPIKLLQMESLKYIKEWSSAQFDTISSLELAIIAVIFVSFRTPIRLPLIRIIILVGLLSMALHHVRHQALLGLIGALILAPGIAASIKEGASKGFGLSSRVLVATLLLALPLAGARLALPVVRIDGPSAPISALSSVSKELRRMPVLNSFGFGGYLIWNGISPYMDGRADMYGDAHFFKYLHIMDGDEDILEKVQNEKNIAWAILMPDEPVVKNIDRNQNWRRIYSDSYAVVFVRKN